MVSRIANKGWEIVYKAPVTASVGLIALLLALFPAMGELLQYERTAIIGGQVWRLVTCYLVHWNVDHLCWDWLMFVVLGAICEMRNRGQMRGCLVAAVAAVSMVVFWKFPEIVSYRGLSGLDTALFTLLATDLFCEAKRHGNKIQAIAMGGCLLSFVAKTIFEVTTGRTLFVDQEAAEFVILVFDHLAGAVVGFIAALIPCNFYHGEPISLSHKMQ